MRNFTPHCIKIIDQNSVVFDPKIRKYVPDERIWLYCKSCDQKWLWDSDDKQSCPICNICYAKNNTGIVILVSNEPIIIASIPSNGMLSGKIETVPGEPIDGVPVYVKKVVGCDPLPDGDDMLIVSAIYAVAARQSGLPMDRLLVIADPVVTPDGNQILGCIGVGPAM